MVGPVPIPIFFKGLIEVLLEGDLGLTGFGGPSGLLFTGSTALSAGPEAIAGCGLSDVAAVEGFIKGTTGLGINYEWPTSVSVSGHFLELNGGIRVYILMWQRDLGRPLHFRWPEESGDVSHALVLTSGHDSIEVISRDYLYQRNYAQWHPVGNRPEVLAVQAVASASADPGEILLQSNVLGLSSPAIAVSGNMRCLVWLYDEPSRNSVDRTMLVYSLNDGRGWTAPVAIDDDGTADFLPVLSTDSKGNFVCLWSSASQTLPDETNLMGMADSLDIKVAVYDPAAERWMIETITDAPGLDYLAKVASGRELTVAWVHDDDSDILGELGSVTNSIMVRTRKEFGWSQPQTIATVGGLIKRIDLASDESSRYIVCCLDQDSILLTEEDNDLYLLRDVAGGWSDPIQITDASAVSGRPPNNHAVADVNPRFVKTSAGITLLWSREGRIVGTTDFVGLTDMENVVAQEGSSGQRSFVATAGPNDTISVVWNDPSAEGMDLYTVTFDPAVGIWSSILQMTHSRDMERSIGAVYSDAKTLTLAYNKVHIQDAAGLDTFGQVDLCLYDYEVGADLKVVGESVAIDSVAVPGDTVTLTATITNQGDVSSNEPIEVAFYWAMDPVVPEAQIGQTQVVAGRLAPRSEADLSVPWRVPEGHDMVYVTVVVDPASKLQDRDRLNNVFSIPIGANGIELVHFKDAKLQAAVEMSLGKSNPTSLDMLSLVELFASDANIDDLTGLEYAANIEHLDLSVNRIRDLVPLSRLTELRTLHISRNSITSLTPLSSVIGLKELDLAENQISNVRALSSLTNLYTLELRGNQITDISAMSMMRNLVELNLSSNKIGDIGPLSNLAALQDVKLAFNQIVDVGALAGLMSLEWLDLSQNPLNQEACEVYIPQIRANNPGVQVYETSCAGCTLTVSSTTGGWVYAAKSGLMMPVNGTIEYPCGIRVPVSARADRDYHFVEWTGTAVTAGKVAIPTSASTTVTVDADYTLVANFAPDEPEPEYSLSVTITPFGAGSVARSPNKATYSPGEEVTLTVATVYAFVGWSGDLNGSKNPATIVMDSDKSVEASFDKTQYKPSVYIDPPGAGWVVFSPYKPTYAVGETVTITAVPASGYDFVRWSGIGALDVADIFSATTTFTVQVADDLIAVFRAK